MEKQTKRSPIFCMFRDTLHLVVKKYGSQYAYNQDFLASKDAKYLERLAELVQEENEIRIIEVDPNLN